MKIIRSCADCPGKQVCECFLSLTTQEKLDYLNRGMIHPGCELPDAPVKDERQVIRAVIKWKSLYGTAEIYNKYVDKFLKSEEYQSIPDATTTTCLDIAFIDKIGYDRANKEWEEKIQDVIDQYINIGSYRISDVLEKLLIK